MNTIKIDKKNAKMVAHAGLQGLESPNTNAGFIAAGGRSYFGVETDVRVTKDKQIVVIHDDNLRSISGVDMSVEQSTLAQLQSVPVYDRPFFWDMEKYGYTPQQGRFRSDLRVPSLAEYVAICKKYEKACVLELKSHMDEDDVDAIISEFRRQDHLDSAIFISFDWDNLVRVRSRLPEQPVQFLTGETQTFPDEFVDKVAASRFDLDIHVFTATKALVDRLHGKGIRVNCWTVDWPDRARQLADWGVDYITTDILE